MKAKHMQTVRTETKTDRGSERMAKQPDKALIVISLSLALVTFCAACSRAAAAVPLTREQARAQLEAIYSSGRDAFKTKRAAFFEGLLAPDFVAVQPNGATSNREQQLGQLGFLLNSVKEVKQSVILIHEIRLTDTGFVAVFTENDWFEFNGANNTVYNYLRLATVRGTFVAKGDTFQETRAETLREQTNLIPTVSSKSPLEVDRQDAALVAQAKAELDALYKGDYNKAWVNKQPELLGKHFSPQHIVSNIDGTTTTGAEVVELVRGAQQNLDRVPSHTVSIEDVTTEGNRIYAVVTNNLVLEYKSPAGQKWILHNQGTFRDGFEKTASGLVEVSAQHLGQLVVTYPLP
jgi:hypothetical protein